MTFSGPQPDPLPVGEEWLELKDTVRRFERAWREGARPGIDAYLPADEPLRARVLIELVHIDLELRLKAGEAARTEDYLTRYPELAGRSAVALGLINAEYELRRRHELGLTLEDYRQRFPQYQAGLPGESVPVTVGATDAPPCPAAGHAEGPLQIAGYEILGLLGRGGMGVVYRARQHSLDRLVALKFLPEECTRDPVWLARFRREARTASALNHPHVCTIYDTGECDGRPFLSMELIEGRTLEALVGRRPPLDELARLLAQVAQALAAAHAVGVVHRDVKPANVMVRDDGIAKVLDFGLARRPPTGDTPVPGDRSTAPGTRVGTPLYMSPEQAQAGPVDAASDIFSLGLVLYELATGQHPFRGRSQVEVLYAIVSQPLVPPSRVNPEVPAALEALIEGMLAKDPRLRPTAVEVEAALLRLARQPAGMARAQSAGPVRPPTVGRQQELAGLRAAFAEAASGRGLLVCVTGEPGLGKTTLVETFLDELAAADQRWSLARGRCSERLAGTEAYLPFLEALDSLIHGEHGSAAARALKLLAPTWYVQLAPLAGEDPSLAGARGASQERRKRELGAFLQEVSRQCPLVVFLDDVHWADPSSTDLLLYLAGKLPRLRLLFVLTYRPSELLTNGHPFGPVKLELQGRGICREVALPFLCRDDIQRYLALAFAGHRFPDQLAAILHARTEGNPLFVVDLLRYLGDRGVIVLEPGRWVLARSLPDLEQELPESVRSMVQRKVEQLDAADRQLLMAASVQGAEFDSTVVARLLGREAADVEERLVILERVHCMVRRVREQAFPDQTLTLRYSFVHVLYQNALYAALQPTRKATWSRAAAQTLLERYGEKSTALAAELAMLFEAARDHERAADYCRLAADNAARLFAHHEAVALSRRGLALLQALPDTPARARRELVLQITLGIQLQIAQGYAAAEAEPAFARASELCEQLQEPQLLFTVLRGLWAYHEVRAALGKSRPLADRLLALAEGAADPVQMVQARVALTATSLCQGDPAATRQHVKQGVAYYEPKRHIFQYHLYAQDPKVAFLAIGAVALWLLGFPDQAAEDSRQAIALGRELGQPNTLALALHFGAILRQYRRETPGVRENAEATTAIAIEHGFTFWHAASQIMHGWVEVEQGAGASGVAHLREGLGAYAATGGATYRTYFLALLAEALGREGQYEEGLAVLAEAQEQADATGEGFHRAELHRLQGELLRRQPAASSDREAEVCFRQALDMARRQEVRSLELRAAMSLTRLCHKQGRQAEARPLLAACYGWFTEGFDTPDLQEAKVLLDQIL
jgi:predicted ATPase